MRSLENTFSHLASVVACSCPCQVEASCLPAHIHISMYAYHSVVVFVQLVLVRLISVTSNSQEAQSMILWLLQSPYPSFAMLPECKSFVYTLSLGSTTLHLGGCGFL